MRSRSNSSDTEELSKKTRVDDDPNGANAFVFTSFSVTCEIVPVEGVPNERAHLMFAVIPRVSSDSSSASVVPDGFRTNCLNEYSDRRPRPISVGILPYMHSSNELTMEYVGPIDNELQEYGNLVLREIKEYGGWYSSTVGTMHEEYEKFRADQQQTTGDKKNRNYQYTNSYSTMMGHRLVIRLDNANFERITAIAGLMDFVIANGIVEIYTRIGEVIEHYTQLMPDELNDRKIRWIENFSKISMQRSMLTNVRSPLPGLLGRTIDEQIGISINRFEYNGAGPFYVVGEYIVEDRYASQKYNPANNNDRYHFSSTSDIPYPYGLHAPSFAWSRTAASVSDLNN
jgi:hypothetical protein